MAFKKAKSNILISRKFIANTMLQLIKKTVITNNFIFQILFIDEA